MSPPAPPFNEPNPTINPSPASLLDDFDRAVRPLIDEPPPTPPPLPLPLSSPPPPFVAADAEEGAAAGVVLLSIPPQVASLWVI